MTVHDYQHARGIESAAPSLRSLLMAAMLRATDTDEAILRSHFRDVYDELRVRFDAPRGLLAGEKDGDGWFRDDDGVLYNDDGEAVPAEDEPDS